MEIITIENDITVFYETATSFPDGALAAHEKLHAKVPYTDTRRYFGVSRPENAGVIVYRAAAEELEPGEAEKYGCDKLVLKKGRYISTILKNYVEDISSIERTFAGLLEHPSLDPQGYCVELFMGQKDMRCMVRLED